MKTPALVCLAVFACSAAHAVEKKEAPFHIYPKNQARHHIGANLFIYDQSTKTYAPANAAAAWLDDDITTGWPMHEGKQYYLLALPQAELLTNFAISAQPAAGSITLYAGDEPTPPGDKKWNLIARDVAFNEVNEQTRTPFSRLARYLLIETNVAAPGSVYSLYLYNEKPAAAYNLIKREKPLDAEGVNGADSRNGNNFNLAGLYAKAVVSYAGSTDGYVGWQRALDDNPESALRISPSGGHAAATIKFPETRTISRLAVLIEPGAKGKLDLFLSEDAPAGEDEQEPTAVSTLTPAATFVFDGTNARSGIDIPPTGARSLMVRWTPENRTDSIAIRELNAFGDLDLQHYAVSTNAEPIGEKLSDRSKGGKSFKEAEPIAEGAEPEPVADFLPTTGPYLPGSLGFPPNVDGISINTPNRVTQPPGTLPPTIVLPPEEPVSQ